LRSRWKIHESCGSDDPIDGRKDKEENENDEGSSMKAAIQRILTINGGSSSIKFALFEAGDPLQRVLDGGIERIGLPEATLRVKALNSADNVSRLVTAPDHTKAVGVLMDWIEERRERDALTAVGHRVVHGGPKYSMPQRITAEMVEELHRLSPFDPEHLSEIRNWKWGDSK
jgi:acetate kinase